MREFLLEILCEEIPARMQLKAQEDLKNIAANFFRDHHLEFEGIQTYITPRRLVLFVPGLLINQPDIIEERKGPKVDAPKQAIDGFLKSTGLNLEDCEKREIGKGTFLFAILKKQGRPTAEILMELTTHIIKSFEWTKSMSWGSYDMRWVRPINHLLALFDNKALDVDLEDIHVECNNSTRGHRFMSHDKFTIVNFTDYQLKLRDNFVIIDHAERQKIISAKARELCEKNGFVLKEDQKLLEEVAGLVEWPIVLLGKIDNQFMALPPEVLMTSMRSHQKYFSVLHKNGSMAPYFIMVSHIDSPDGGKQIIEGNERVLRARLSDAQFFWETDRNKSLDDWNKDLKDYIFHEKLGSTLDRVHRLEKLVKLINPKAKAERAAQLCKADLVTEMVGEFPELQGIMGSYYAKEMNESEETVLAIKEHYSPMGQQDTVPTNAASVTLALADKIDTLVSFWSIGIQPTGSKDPYALRRSALGIIRLIHENKLSINLLDIYSKAYDLIPTTHGKKDKKIVLEELRHFMVERLKHYFKDSYDGQHIQAVLSDQWNGSILQSESVLKEFSDLIETETGQNLITGYKRAANILSQAERGDIQYKGVVKEALLQQDEEKALYHALTAAHHEIQSLLKKDIPDYKTVMKVLAGLRLPIDKFFDCVLVQAEDHKIRENRLNLMTLIKNQLQSVADFSKI
jgi:glycyl-tRNA synthetase beta chain